MTATTDYPVRTAFQKFYPKYFKEHHVSPQQNKAAYSIMNCKTGNLGYSVSRCEDCGHLVIHTASCNNRHCPCCQKPVEDKWIQERNSELIKGIAYYHAIFTVPKELNELIFANQKLLYNLMFKCSSDTLITLCKDKKYMGATPGIVSVLHTQGQTLTLHPHVHVMISGGGLTKEGTFIETSHKGFIIPVRAMGKMFRGKFLDALEKYHDDGKLIYPAGQETLEDPFSWNEFISSLYGKKWVPFIKETFNGNGNAVRYLARYVFRSAISNSRIDKVDDTGVTFHYKDYADGSKTKSMHMSGEEFIHAFLRHILPDGFCRVRFSGYLSNCVKTKNLKTIHKLRNSEYSGNPVKGMKMKPLIKLLYDKDIDECPVCHGRLVPVLPRAQPGFQSRSTDLGPHHGNSLTA